MSLPNSANVKCETHPSFTAEGALLAEFLGTFLTYLLWL